METATIVDIDRMDICLFEGLLEDDWEDIITAGIYCWVAPKAPPMKKYTHQKVVFWSPDNPRSLQHISIIQWQQMRKDLIRVTILDEGGLTTRLMRWLHDRLDVKNVDKMGQPKDHPILETRPGGAEAAANFYFKHRDDSGITQELVAKLFDVGISTLRRHLRRIEHEMGDTERESSDHEFVMGGQMG